MRVILCEKCREEVDPTLAIRYHRKTIHGSRTVWFHKKCQEQIVRLWIEVNVHIRKSAQKVVKLGAMT